MRIATWNVNSLKARHEKVSWWLERAAPDVLLMQETKLTDEHAPHEELARLGYELAHHGQGRWNGVAIASKVGLRELAARVVASEIDREARKGKPTPSDHAPVFVDLDEPGRALDAGWRAAAQRIAARRST